MKIHIYKDSQGNTWHLTRQSLPKKRGVYIFWEGELETNWEGKKLTGKYGFKRDSMKELKEAIETLIEKQSWSTRYPF